MSVQPNDSKQRRGPSNAIDAKHDHQHHPSQHRRGSDDASESGASSLSDPVCGMSVTADSQFHVEHDGQQYLFCSQSCENKFTDNPTKYASTTPGAPVHAAPEGTVYTCPMHPQIRQDRPGNCPICGMALEPLLPSLEDEENPELVDFRRRFWWTLPLTAVVFVLAMFGHRLSSMGASTLSWVEFVLSTPVVMWAGLPFFERCIRSLSTAARTCGHS